MSSELQENEHELDNVRKMLLSDPFSNSLKKKYKSLKKRIGVCRNKIAIQEKRRLLDDIHRKLLQNWEDSKNKIIQDIGKNVSDLLTDDYINTQLPAILADAISDDMIKTCIFQFVIPTTFNNPKVKKYIVNRYGVSEWYYEPPHYDLKTMMKYIPHSFDLVKHSYDFELRFNTIQYKDEKWIVIYDLNLFTGLYESCWCI